MTDDGRLLEQWTRHLNFVYSVCLREMGDPTLADDVTQVVFLLLARKALSLGPALSAQFNGALKTMTPNKLKLAAAFGTAAALVGSLPFVTLAQARKYARPLHRKPIPEAQKTASTAMSPASKPAPPTTPKTLHVVYALLSKDHPPVPAEYWAAAPDSARWTWNGRYPTTITTDGKTWM